MIEPVDSAGGGLTMTVFENFSRFVEAENSTERLQSLENLVHDKPKWQRDLLIWKVLSLSPPRLEKSRIAHTIRMPIQPCSDWAVITTLLDDSDQDVVGNAINAMTLSKNRALGHRVLRFFSSPERPQRILYCLARFAEEAVDLRFAPFLASHLTCDLSDAFLARSFNALFRLGIKSEDALKVASELIASHIDATNMDRKAAVSAIVYMCFAGSLEDIEKLELVRDRVSIP